MISLVRANIKKSSDKLYKLYLFRKIIVERQDIETKSQCNLFHFAFYILDKIDDL